MRLLTEFALSLWQADLFNGITQIQYLFNVETLIFPSDNFAGKEAKLAVLEVRVNPMIYGYGLAVMVGLIMSVPDLNSISRLKQIFIAYVIVVFIQVNGSFWQTIKSLMLTAGPDAQQAVLATGINPNLVAVMYQLSYLIIPAVVPVAAWILMNRSFIEELTGYKLNNDEKL
ncbi:MAG: hypothetical protein L3J52_06105 [Proteobacteria bacterium]|nr:hypothetical protein [Pseudomonadota bacterium]